MPKDRVDPKAAARSLFELAGFEVLRVHELMNQYWPRAEAYYEEIISHPWFLVETPHGNIIFGPRKRVYQIDWRSTKARVVVTQDNVTKDETMVHAWTMDAALKYLTSLKEHIDGITEDH